MEIGILRPKLVITLGAVAFGVFCPELLMKDCFGKIVESKKFGVKVYPVYHPSPRNTSIKERKECFDNNIRTLCKLILACEAKIV
jgi:uracil-DNA glycosylase